MALVSKSAIQDQTKGAINIDKLEDGYMRAATLPEHEHFKSTEVKMLSPLSPSELGGLDILSQADVDLIPHDERGASHCKESYFMMLS